MAFIFELNKFAYVSMEINDLILKMVDRLVPHYVAANKYRLQMDDKNWSKDHEIELGRKVLELHAEAILEIRNWPLPPDLNEQQLLVQRLKNQWIVAVKTFYNTLKDDDLQSDARLQAFLWIESRRLDMLSVV